MNSKKLFWNQFLSFEAKNHLFELKDEQGTFYWDIVRFDVYTKILWSSKDKAERKPAGKNKLMVKQILKDLIKIKFQRKAKSNLFYLTSRNKDKNGLLFDQNAQAAYDCLKDEERIALESYFTKEYEKSRVKRKYLLPQFFFRKIYSYKE